MMTNIYKPFVMEIIKSFQETPDVKTFRLKFKNDEIAKNFSFKTGQFGEYTVFGVGETTFCISSSAFQKDYIECSFKKVGEVTTALERLDKGDEIGFRGPYGNWFEIDEWAGKNLVFVAGGIGLAPIRSCFLSCLAQREKYKDITMIYGARSVSDLVYKTQLNEWEKRDDIKTIYTVDPGGENSSWKGKIGFVPTILEKADPKPDNTVVITCGPPIMIKFVLKSLKKMNFEDEQIITTLEMKMKCGIGKCGRCNIGPYYVCKHGPVFSMAQIKDFPLEY
ncbi:MAG: FAD/NAD(P)-binding protein [Candidatus Coatesbacteria bacterium]|nr:FAD/NAD(P)-binding protein [Candidatus Coatesbacteria bacterium]